MKSVEGALLETKGLGQESYVTREGLAYKGTTGERSSVTEKLGRTHEKAPMRKEALESATPRGH